MSKADLLLSIVEACFGTYFAAALFLSQPRGGRYAPWRALIGGARRWAQVRSRAKRS